MRKKTGVSFKVEKILKEQISVSFVSIEKYGEENIISSVITRSPWLSYFLNNNTDTLEDPNIEIHCILNTS